MRLLLLAMAIGCGGGPHLSHLRCRTTPCQDAEDPLKVHLAVDFTDDTGTLDQGVLDLRVDGQTQQSVALKDVFALQNIAAGTKSGTLEIDQDMVLDQMSQGQQITSSMKATNGQGHDSNEPHLSFTLTIGAH